MAAIITPVSHNACLVARERPVVQQSVSNLPDTLLCPRGLNQPLGRRPGLVRAMVSLKLRPGAVSFTLFCLKVAGDRLFSRYAGQ